MENQTSKKIKCLRTDNGLEFCNTLMDKMCKDSGIKRHKTCSYTPQQNGVAERMNRIIADKIRCMLAESGLEKRFWAEAASTAVYLITITPSAAVEFQIPEELWSGVKVQYDHLRRFGCVAYVHTVQDKMSPRVVKGIFMGYPQGTKGYRVCLPEQEKSTISRNVMFDEEKLYWKSKEEKAKGKRKVSFSPDLIRGPSSSGEGGASSSSSSSESSEDACSEGEPETGTHEDSTSTESLDDYLLARDRARRTSKLPAIFESGDFVAYALSCARDVEVSEPKTYAEARASKDWDKWNASMGDEKTSLDKNHTWDIVNRPKRQRVVGSKWIYKYKEGIPGVEDPRYKSRLVAK